MEVKNIDEWLNDSNKQYKIVLRNREFVAKRFKDKELFGKGSCVYIIRKGVRLNGVLIKFHEDRKCVFINISKDANSFYFMVEINELVSRPYASTIYKA